MVEFTSTIENEKEQVRMTLITERWLENNKINLRMLNLDHLINSKSILE